ncbi:2-hydroxyhepta-2,4-diene-1,7-dioate isomerase [Acidihalobacter aeolianus]|uniref:2-hydroxyhepta-2,4-diene-1,7-dioate isomerase n=1 Tax=Acidihalobacter aeolianus TaxID=2792603 RepID=A0A1D8K8I8_9GAMM|nr:fumarylacetoacetate hydrolase family protein [Acidihalobacter aeolianus]AOV17288.1 2-hydroxyhepta-2,4-diene-1,7-dioate isomerase [Acidihalobacter aeolianus]
MKYLRYGEPGRERPGVLDDAGVIRDLGGRCDDLAGDALDPARLMALTGADLASLPAVDAGVRLGPCVAATRQFIGIGLNYADHAAETGMPIPQAPIVFNKAPGCMAGPNDAIPVPPGAAKVDWEVELALVIGRRAWQVEEADALGHLAGYCICNDVSERAWQLEGTGQWLKGKSAPGFGPLGPWLVTPDEVPDPLSLAMTLEVNGETMQSGSTATMIFGPAYLVSYLSRFMVLEPGDVITTGTPPGVGMARGRFLRPGDRVRARVAGLGEQVNEVT